MASRNPPATQMEALNAIAGIPGIEIESLRVSQTGITLSLPNPDQKGLVKGALDALGWIVTRSSNLLAVEPYPTQTALIPVGATIFHASDRDKRTSITSRGLKPKRGGNTTLQRQFPRPRLHLATNFSGVLAFVNHQVTSEPSFKFDPKLGATYGAPAKRGLDRLDIYAVAAPAGNYYVDSHFEGQGIWTEHSIPAKFIRLLEREEWIPTYLKLYERGAWPQP